MAMKFDDSLLLRAPQVPDDPGGVDATGPKDTGETIQEMCAWVFQERGGSHATATEMTTTGGILSQPDPPGNTWSMALGKIGDLDLIAGPAFAVAVVMTEDANGNQKGLLWAHLVTLVGSGS